MSAFWLSDAGMSTRAIAPIVGVSKDAVQRDRDAQVYRSDTPGLTDDGYPDLLPEPEEDTGAEQVEVYQPFSRDDEPVEPVKITGMDGKEYTRRVPTFCPHLPPIRSDSRGR